MMYSCVHLPSVVFETANGRFATENLTQSRRDAKKIDRGSGFATWRLCVKKLSALIRAIRGKDFSVPSVASCKNQELASISRIHAVGKFYEGNLS